jgi:hypothetical protein
LDLEITLRPAGTTTKREIAELSAEAQNALRANREVEWVAPRPESAPEGAKGVAEAIGAFLVGIPPAAITGVFELLKGLLARAPETPVTVEVSAGSVKLSFDPRRVTPTEMGKLVAKLRPANAH